jgi:predicted AAA+ superfamily ATPase
MFGPRIAAETLRRFWTMLAHHQSGLLNASDFARSLGVDSKTVAAYLDLLVDLLLVRRLEPWHSNGAKRLVKSPRVYVRDSGLLHALLNIAKYEDLLGHPVVGASWEGFVTENLIQAAPEEPKLIFIAVLRVRRSTSFWQYRGKASGRLKSNAALRPRLSEGSTLLVRIFCPLASLSYIWGRRLIR